MNLDGSGADIAKETPLQLRAAASAAQAISHVKRAILFPAATP